MDKEQYDSVVTSMRLPEKQLFGLPVTLDISEPEALKKGDKVLLRWEGKDVAVLEAESFWKPDKVKEAQQCYGTSSLEHPSVYSLVAEQGRWYVGGKVHGLQSPTFKYPVMAPESVRAAGMWAARCTACRALPSSTP